MGDNLEKFGSGTATGTSGGMAGKDQGDALWQQFVAWLDAGGKGEFSPILSQPRTRERDFDGPLAHYYRNLLDPVKEEARLNARGK